MFQPDDIDYIIRLSFVNCLMTSVIKITPDCSNLQIQWFTWLLRHLAWYRVSNLYKLPQNDLLI